MLISSAKPTKAILVYLLRHGRTRMAISHKQSAMADCLKGIRGCRSAMAEYVKEVCGRHSAMAEHITVVFCIHSVMADCIKVIWGRHFAMADWAILVSFYGFCHGRMGKTNFLLSIPPYKMYQKGSVLSAVLSC